MSARIRRIRDGSDVCMYLIEGSQRAALIDTGYGIGNLRGYIESLTDKPYDVFITHGHVDHAAGAGQFEQVFMNKADEEVYKQHCTRDFRMQMLKSIPNLHLEKPDFTAERTEPFSPLEDGEIIELGGISLQWIFVPGHTQGMMVPLMKEERTILFGDACGVGVLLVLPESSSIEEYLESLLRLQTFEIQYDTVLRQHGTCCSPKTVLEDNIENCRNILAGTDDAVPSNFNKIPCFRSCAVNPDTGLRTDGREGNILYLRDRKYRDHIDRR